MQGSLTNLLQGLVSVLSNFHFYKLLLLLFFLVLLQGLVSVIVQLSFTQLVTSSLSSTGIVTVLSLQLSFPQIVTSSLSSTGIVSVLSLQLSFTQIVSSVVSSLSATGDGECIVEQLFISITHSPEQRWEGRVRVRACYHWVRTCVYVNVMNAHLRQFRPL